MDRLEIAVVTGGASGIGEACCRTLASRGFSVVVLDRNADHAARVAKDINGTARVVDMSDDIAVRDRATELEKDLGPIGVLVNCAGIIQGPSRPGKLTMDRWDEVVRINQRGVYVASTAFGEFMVKRRKGSIVNIASVGGMRSMPLHAYAPAKAAVISMTECLAAEWGPAGVRVNSVSPGFTRTAGLQAAIDERKFDPTPMTEHAALGRLVETEEIAKAVAFLASSDAAAITGINLPVDCGWLVASTWPAYGGLRPPE